MSNIRTQGPVILLLICGSVLILAGLSSLPILSVLENELNSWGIILTNFTVFIGAVSVIMFSASRIRKKSDDWQYELCTIGFFIIFLVVGLAQGTGADFYLNMYNSIILPIGIAFAGLQGILLVSGFYTGFKVRSFDSLLLFLTAIIHLLASAPIGEAIWWGFGPLGAWVNEVFVTAATRVVVMTAGIGAIILGFRTLFGFERKVTVGGED